MTENNAPAQGTESEDAVAPDPIADVSGAPLPTSRTLKQRKSLVMQAGRFVIFNSRMIRLVFKGQH
ncbi:MAG: hypothetical protein ACK5MP_01990 [Nostocoides sp.]